jgi:hypothetical protein
MSDSNLKKPGELVNLVNFPGYFRNVLSARAAKKEKSNITFSLTPKQVNEVHKFTSFFKVGIMPKRGVRGVVLAVFMPKADRSIPRVSSICEYIELLLTDMRLRRTFVRGSNKAGGHGRIGLAGMCELRVNFQNRSSHPSRALSFVKVGGL